MVDWNPFRKELWTWDAIKARSATAYNVADSLVVGALPGGVDPGLYPFAGLTVREWAPPLLDPATAGESQRPPTLGEQVANIAASFKDSIDIPGFNLPNLKPWLIVGGGVLLALAARDK